MKATVPFRSKPRALAAAIAVIVSMGGCASLPRDVAMDQPIIPIQRNIGEVAKQVPSHYYERGRGYFQAGKYGLALQAFEDELSEHPRSIMALNGVAAVYDQLGRYDLAVSYYYRALQLDPNSARTLSNLGYSFLLQHRADAARGVLEMAASLDPDNAVIARHLKMATDVMAAMPAKTTAVAQAQAQPAATQLSPLPARPAVTAVPVPATVTAPPAATTAAAPTSEKLSAPSMSRDQERAPAVAAEPDVADAVPASIAAAEPATQSAPAAMPEDQPQQVVGQDAVVTVVKPDAVGMSMPSVDEQQAQVTVIQPVVQSWQEARVSDATLERHPAVAATAQPEAPVAVVTPGPTVTTAHPSASVSTVPDRHVQAVVVVERTTPPAVRKVSEETGHVQLAFDTPEGSVEVSNGNGYEGMARLLSRYYADLGQQIAHITNAEHFDHDRTVIYYQAGKRQVAEALQARLPVAVKLREASGMRTDVRLILGRDMAFYRGALQRITRADDNAADVASGGFSLPSDEARIEVSNGNGRNGMARLLSRVIDHLGGSVTRVTNADTFSYPTTVIYYATGQEDAARALAERLPVAATLKPVSGEVVRRNVGVRVIIGRDFLRYEKGMQDLLADVPNGRVGV